MIPIFTHDMTITTKEKRAKEPLSPVQAALAQRLRVLREARFPAVTQGDIAKLVGRTRSAVCLWESGETEPSCANLVKLSEFYGVSRCWVWKTSLRSPGLKRLWKSIPFLC